MPATFTLPPFDMYQGIVRALQSNLMRAPAEGNLVIPLSINWGNDSPANQAIHFNLNNIQQNKPSQIIALYVNNLMSNVDAVFKFGDMPFQLTIPAQSQGLYPVDTTSLDFYVQANPATGTTTDEVFFTVYNYLPPPIAIERAFITSINGTSGISLITGITPLVAAPKNGIVTGIVVAVTGVQAGAGNGTWLLTIQDGASDTIATMALTMLSGDKLDYAVLYNVTGLNVPFRNGVTAAAVFSGTAFVSGAAEITLYTR